MAVINDSTVVDSDGVRGTFDERALSHPNQPVVVTLQDGQRIPVSAALFTAQAQGIYALPIRFGDLQPQSSVEQQVIPVIQEEAVVDKRWVETGRVQIRKVVQEVEETIDDLLLRDEVEVQRVPVNRVLDEPVGTHYEGETLVIPLVEEELVIEKRYVLKEEIRITRRQIETPIEQPVTLRKEDIIVEHTPPTHEGDSRSERPV